MVMVPGRSASQCRPDRQRQDDEQKGNETDHRFGSVAGADARPAMT